MSRNRKLSYKWLGPYRVKKAIPEKGTYILEEFDGIELAGTHAGNRLKKFVERHRFYVPVTMDPESSESDEGELPPTENPVRRSARIQQAAQQTNAPRPERFVIVPPTLTVEQRREYVQYEEDEEGNLI